MNRGREARSPREIPWTGWKDVLYRVKDEVANDHVSLVAAGVAFYSLLAIFPAITALLGIAGLLLEPSDVTAQIESVAAVLPERAAQIIIDQATAVAGSQTGGLSLTVIVGILLALYSASKGVSSLVEGMNVAYDEEDSRGFIKRTALVLALTLFLMIGVIVALGAVLVLPALLAVVQLGPVVEVLIGLVRWVVLLIGATLAIAVLYRYGPNRRAADWRWLMPGAALACILWLIASIGFSYYAENFGSYQETFGTLAGVIVLLMWLWISAYVVLAGAELNSEAEAQTRVDTTVGKDMPMGARGAVKADNLGEAKT